jgi:hypothetical protein
MSDFKEINLKKIGNPTIYRHKDSFIKALEDRLNNENLSVTVNWRKFEDTRADVLIDNTVVGMIVSYYENLEIPDDVILYFIPNIDFFKFVNIDNIEHFIKLSNQFLESYVENISVNKNVNEVKLKKFEDFDLDLSASQKSELSGMVFNRKIECTEKSRFVFNLIKDGSSFKLVDDFKMSIKNRSATMFDIIGTQDYAIFESNRMFSASLLKNGDTYYLNHEYSDPLHSLSFNKNDSIPDMKRFISVLFYYSIMKTNKLEMPNVDDFINRFDDYKQVIEMSII